MVDSVSLTTARAWIKANAAPAIAIPELNLLRNPGWNMLLDLYVSSHADRTVTVKEACIASCSSPTTGLRYISTLVHAGLILRLDDPNDGRKSYVLLTTEGLEGVERAIDLALRSCAKLGLAVHFGDRVER